MIPCTCAAARAHLLARLAEAVRKMRTIGGGPVVVVGPFLAGPIEIVRDPWCAHHGAAVRVGELVKQAGGRPSAWYSEDFGMKPVGLGIPTSGPSGIPSAPFDLGVMGFRPSEPPTNAIPRATMFDDASGNLRVRWTDGTISPPIPKAEPPPWATDFDAPKDKP